MTHTASEKASYYAPGIARGWSPENFKDETWARSYVVGDADRVEFLAVPVAHMQIENDARVRPIAEALSPWKGETIERWRRGLKGAVWLTIVRVYSFAAVEITLQQSNRLHATVRPFRARSLRAVIAESIWEEKMQTIKGEIEEIISVKPSGVTGAPLDEIRPYSSDQMSKETGLDLEEIKKYKRLLARKKQLVFYGPPGTGKTYIAEKLAESIVHGGHGFYQTIQFHPSYAYEDFVQGLRPKTRDGRVVYEMAEGVFLRFCKQAEEVKPAPCVFMIDELNRAPLARVLGELLYLLEYRQKAVVLAGGARHFQSPKMFT